MLQVNTVREAETTLEELILQAIHANDRVVTIWMRGITLQNKRAYVASLILTTALIWSYWCVPNTLGSLALSGIYCIILRTSWSNAATILKVLGIDDEARPTAEDKRLQGLLAENMGRRFGKFFRRLVLAYRAYSKYGLSTNLRESYPLYIFLGTGLVSFSVMPFYRLAVFMVIGIHLWAPGNKLLKRFAKRKC